MQRTGLLIIILLSVITTTYAQVAKDSKLFIELAKLDSLLFDEGFNNCEIAFTKALVHEDFEFYHDQGGLETSKANFLATISQNICGNPAAKPIRKLVAESLQVHPLYNNGELYGAIQSGSHEFYIKETGKAMYQTSVAQFTHIWIKDNDEWKLKRVLSYDHKDPPKK